jgi:hypothetical protein
MKIYLAGTQGNKGNLVKNNENINLLESFFYLKDNHMDLYKKHNFLLDSGAFTFMNKKKGKTDWYQYINDYGNFINKHDIKNFFELDIDSIVGLKEVEKLRDKLESLTNKKCIPVWHKSRGLEYWKKMCKEYDYVAIGGLVTQEIKRSEHDIFYPLLKIANENNTKVHGLGFTNLKGLQKYKFYSVDSTSWISGQKYMCFYTFDGKTLIKTNLNKPNFRGINPQGRLEYNFDEWIKFSKYAENNL